MKRTRAVVEVFARTSGAAAARLAIPLFGGVGLISAVLFPQNGLSSSDVVALERTSVAVRLALWTGWILLAVPPARALLGAPSAAWARSLPIGRPVFLGLSCASLIGLQAPLILLFARGRGPLDGLGAGVLSAALAAGIASFRAMRWARVALVVPIIAVGTGLPLSVAGAAALPVCALAAHAGFFAGGAVPVARTRLVRGPAPIALAGALIAKLARGERTAVLRALFTAAGGGILGALGARNNERLGEGFEWLVLPIATIPLVIGAGVIAGPIVRADAALGWLLDSTGMLAPTRIAGRFGAAAAFGAVSGMTAALSTRLLANVPVAVAVRTGAVLVIWGAAIQILAVFVVRRAAKTGHKEGGMTVAWLTGLGVFAVLTAGLLDAPALAVGLSAVVAAAAVDAAESRLRHGGR